LAGLAGCPQGPAGGKAASTPAAGTAPLQGGTPTGALSLWADPVLAAALTGLERDYHAATGGSYQVTPVERGALLEWAKSGDAADRPAPDVLLFAGNATLAALLAGKRIDEATSRTFAGDRLVVLKPLGSSFEAHKVFDLADLHFQHLAVADPDKTALGFYTQEALQSDGALPRVKSRLQAYPDSTLLPTLPGKDASTLAFAFMSQAGGAAKVEPLLLVDKSLHEAVQYRAAAVAAKGQDAAAQGFLRWLAENDKTQQALGGYGLLSRAITLGLDAPIGATTPSAPPAAGAAGGKSPQASGTPPAAAGK
jgi:molybdenum ABC transporter molybdate-binding protein